MRSWEQYIRDQEAAEGPEESDAPFEFFICPTHGETFDGGGFCGSCYVEEIQAGERLAAEWKKDEAALRAKRPGD